MTFQACMKDHVNLPAVRLTYDCFPLSAQQTLRKPQGPLPLQKNARANLEWALAFIDHTGSLISTHEQEYLELRTKYKLALDTIKGKDTEIDSLQTDNCALHHRIEHLQGDNNRQQKAHQRLHKRYDDLCSQTKADKDTLTKKLAVTSQKLNAAESDVKSLEAKLRKADQKAHAAWKAERQSDIKDHKEIDDLRKDLERETKANCLLQDKLNGNIKQLLEIEQELQIAKDRKIVSEKEITILNSKIEQLKQDIANRNRTIERYHSDLTQVRVLNAALTCEKTQLSTNLEIKTEELHNAKQELTAAREKITSLSDKLSREISAAQVISNQLRDQKYQNENLRNQFATTIKEHLEMIDTLTKHDKEDEQKIIDLSENMTSLSVILTKALANDKSDRITIAELRKKVSDLEAVQESLREKIGRLEVHDSEDHVGIGNLNETLAALKATLRYTEEQKKASDNNSQDLKKTVENLQLQFKKVTSDDAKDKATIQKYRETSENILAQLTKAREAAQKAEAEAFKKVAEAEAKQKAAEQAAAKVVSDLELAKKPLLQNDVKLTNPIALVGSLKGAPYNVDDKTFNIKCSFHVKLFNTCSSDIYISSNGLFTLDQASTKFDYQRLPCPSLPSHVLAPFWADLYIYKGTPQGIYYEETGLAPNRKLEVEWYVSRYNGPKQYYHFSLVVEEAKPNIAIFKYFKALDKGGKCTIGVQGPKTSKMFSYNEEKIFPGTQVTFDTLKNSFTTSEFKIPATTPNGALKGSDGKPANAVSATVREIYS